MPDPRDTPHLIGHAAVEAALHHAVHGPRLHHAWLIGGPSGIGKATLAYRFARYLLAAPPRSPTAPDRAPSLAIDPAHGVFRRVAAGTHADLMTVELGFDPTRKRQRTEIPVDDVRAVPAFLRRTAAEGGWRVVIIDGAEHMNRHGANSLLKALEEPPARALLLCVSHAPGSLLPTLRSRCRTLSLSPLPDLEMQHLIAQALPDLPPPDRTRLIALADGSIGRALMLAQQGGLATAALAEDVLACLPVLTPARMLAITDEVLRAETGFSSFIDLLRRALARAVRAAAAGEPNPLGRRLAAQRPLGVWSELWRALEQLRAETEFAYLDKRQAMLTALRMVAG